MTKVTKEDIGIGFTFLATGGAFTFKVTEKSKEEDKWKIVNVTPGYEESDNYSWQTTKYIIDLVIQVVSKKDLIQDNRHNIKVGDIIGRSSVDNINEHGVSFIAGSVMPHSGFSWERINARLDSGEWVIESKVEEVIEVGDIIYITDYIGEEEYTVYEVLEDRYLISKLGNYILKKDATLYKKAAKREIISYELLKELPGIPQGTKSSPYMGKGRGGVLFEYNTKVYSAADSDLEDLNWFKPIYKPTTIRVDISDEEDGTKRIVEIEGDKIKLNSGIEWMTKKQFIQTASEILGTAKVNTGRKLYSYEIIKVKIGCQYFTKEDVINIHKAVKSQENDTKV